MSLIAVVPQRELAFQANALFEGQTYKVFLALNPNTLNEESDLSLWLAAECSGGGYVAATGTVATGAWNAATGRYELPFLTLSVTATGSGFSFDSIVTKIGSTRTGVANVTTLPSTIALAAGQSRTYQVRLVQDD